MPGSAVTVLQPCAVTRTISLLADGTLSPDENILILNTGSGAGRRGETAQLGGTITVRNRRPVPGVSALAYFPACQRRQKC